MLDPDLYQMNTDPQPWFIALAYHSSDSVLVYLVVALCSSVCGGAFEYGTFLLVIYF